MNSEFDHEASRPSDPGRSDTYTDPPAATCDEPTHSSTVTYSYAYEAREDPRHFSFDHDSARGLFILTTPDGTTEHFRDNPVRYLVVEPDLDTGELRPAARNGRPVYLYLCREQREV